MPERPETRVRRLANERALYRYNQAFERGDIETIADILHEASHNEDLERMIYLMHDTEQSMELAPDFFQHDQSQSDIAISSQQSVLRSNPHYATRQRGIYSRVQMLAAVLVVLALIAGSMLLFSSLHATMGSKTASFPTKAVPTSQGMVILLFTDGHIQAVRGGTGQTVWRYATGQSALSTDKVFYSGLTVQNQTVYVMAKNHIYALKENTGQLLWQKTLAITRGNVPPNESQLIIDAGIIYVSIQGEKQGAVYALSASDGHQLWQASSPSSNSPLLTASGGVAYIAIQNEAANQTIFEARNGHSGDILWSSQSSGMVSFATVASNVLYIYAFPGAFEGGAKVHKRLLALKVGDGSQIWSHDVNYGNYATTIAYANGTLVVDDHNQLCVHNASNGNQLWCAPASPLPANSSGPYVISYLAGSNKLYVAYLMTDVPSTQTTADVSIQIKALDYQTGQTFWARNMSVLKRKDWYVTFDLFDKQKTLLVSDSSHFVTGLDAESGQTLWHINGSAPPEILQMAATV